jgi:FMN phosphatase YigB (HAD superfamily)
MHLSRYLAASTNQTDPDYFQSLLDHFGLTKDQVLYFEHNLEAVKSAQTIGIPSYYYDSTNQDLIALKSFLDHNLA